jgi:hypothetical protein
LDALGDSSFFGDDGRIPYAPKKKEGEDDDDEERIAQSNECIVSVDTIHPRMGEIDRKRRAFTSSSQRANTSVETIIIIQIIINCITSIVLVDLLVYLYIFHWMELH